MNSLTGLNELFAERDSVVSMDIRIQDFKYDLALTMASSGDANVGAVTVCFHDVSALDLSGFGGGLTQFIGLSVSRVDAGLDRIRYVLRDTENDKISFCFFTFGAPIHEE